MSGPRNKGASLDFPKTESVTFGSASTLHLPGPHQRADVVGCPFSSGEWLP
jgi:hypothetical protein